MRVFFQYFPPKYPIVQYIAATIGRGLRRFLGLLIEVELNLFFKSFVADPLSFHFAASYVLLIECLDPPLFVIYNSRR